MRCELFTSHGPGSTSNLQGFSLLRSQGYEALRTTPERARNSSKNFLRVRSFIRFKAGRSSSSVSPTGRHPSPRCPPASRDLRVGGKTPEEGPPNEHARPGQPSTRATCWPLGHAPLMGVDHPNPYVVVTCQMRTIKSYHLDRRGPWGPLSWPFSDEKLRHRGRSCRAALSFHAFMMSKRQCWRDGTPAPGSRLGPPSSPQHLVQDASRGSERTCALKRSKEPQELSRFKSHWLGAAHHAPTQGWGTTPGPRLQAA